jgi:hypothetical protein
VDEGDVLEAPRIVYELGEHRSTYAASTLDRIEVHEILPYAETGLVPQKQACQPNYPPPLTETISLARFPGVSHQAAVASVPMALQGWWQASRSPPSGSCTNRPRSGGGCRTRQHL